MLVSSTTDMVCHALMIGRMLPPWDCRLIQRKSQMQNTARSAKKLDHRMLMPMCSGHSEQRLLVLKRV